MRSVAALGLAGLLASALPLAAQAAEQCGPDAMRDHPPQINFRVDNDLLVAATRTRATPTVHC